MRAQKLRNRVESDINSNQEELKDSLHAFTENTKEYLYQTLNNINDSIQAEFNSIPDRSMNLFDRVVKDSLVHISDEFRAVDYALYDVEGHTLNLMRALLRRVYDVQRKKAEAGVRNLSEELRDSLNARSDRYTESAIDAVYLRADTLNNRIEDFINVKANQAKDINQEAFEEIDKEIIALANEVDRKLTNFKEEVENANVEMKKSSENTSIKMMEISQDTLLNIYLFILFVSFLSMTLLAIVMVKSFFYVFSRIAFAEGNELFIDLKDDPKTYENGVIRESGKEYSIPIDNDQTIYVSRKYVPTGRAPKIAVPNWNQGIIARLRHGLYLMNKIEVRPNEQETVDFKSVAGAEFVEWNLKPNEEIVFRYQDVLAFSKSVNLRTHLSFKITSLFFGRALFHIAKGPGKIVLMTQGKPITHHQEELVKSVAIHRIVAWQRHTQFSIDSELGMVDMYLSDVYLKRTNNDLIIIDADAGNVKRKVGLARFIRKFMMPF